MVVEEVIVIRNNKADITLAIPIESEPTRKLFVSVTTLEPSSTHGSRWNAARPGTAYQPAPEDRVV